jgi:hypothetical protein
VLHRVAVTVYSQYPACEDVHCLFRKQCANHTTAGDFRSEDGLTPDLKEIENGEWWCSQNPCDQGAILIDGSLITPFISR